MNAGRWARPLAFAVAAVVLAALLAALPPARRVELWASDAQQRLVTPDRSFPDVVLVAIDDQSMTRLRGLVGGWPYRRDVYARLVDFLSAAGARAIVFDILFTDPRAGDEVFATALSRGVPAALAAVATPYSLELEPQDRSIVSRRGWRAGPEVPARAWADIRLPQAGLTERAAIGIVTVEPDEDGIVRRLTLLHRIGGGAVLPSLALAGRFPQTPGPPVSVPEPGVLRIGDEPWPVDADGRVTLAFGRQPYQTVVVPFSQVVEAAMRAAPTPADDALRASLGDRTVFVGSTALLLEDATPTPVGLVPGVTLAVQAHLALTHHLVLAPASWRWNLLVACLGLALATGVRLAGFDSLRLLSAAAAAGLIIAWAASLALLLQLKQPTAVLTPLLAAGLFLAFLIAERMVALHATRVRLTNERVAVERTAQLKSEFLAHVSHELRTPLTSILGFSRVLADESSLAADKRALVQIIRRNGEQLLWLVNNLLDQARIAASQMTIDPQPTSVRDSIDYVSALLAGVPRRVGVELQAACAEEVPGWVLVDAQRFQQILINLAANGLKFTEQGSVRMDVSWQAGWLEARVDDTGPGISPSALAAIFDAFNQGEASIARRGGTGLGLTISRNLSRLMGGDLTVVSTVGLGSTFRLRVPAPAVARHAEAVADPGTIPSRALAVASDSDAPAVAPLRTVRALVADDSEDIRAFLEIYLTRLGLEVRLAINGREAVDLGLAHRPDVILLDVQMPTMGGIEAVRLLRAAGFTGRVVALTAGSGDQLQGELIAAGFDTVVFKPVTGNEITDALARLLGLPRPPAATATLPGSRNR